MRVVRAEGVRVVRAEGVRVVRAEGVRAYPPCSVGLREAVT